MANKPSDNHPWKTGPTNEVIKWAKEQSDTPNVQTVLVARNKTLARKDRTKMEGGMK